MGDLQGKVAWCTIAALLCGAARASAGGGPFPPSVAPASPPPVSSSAGGGASIREHGPGRWIDCERGLLVVRGAGAGAGFAEAEAAARARALERLAELVAGLEIRRDAVELRTEGLVREVDESGGASEPRIFPDGSLLVEVRLAIPVAAVEGAGEKRDRRLCPTASSLVEGGSR